MKSLLAIWHFVSLILPVILLFSVLSAIAGTKVFNVEVLGLFKDAALLEIAGKQILLKVGERSVEGVLLISSDSREATIEHSGHARVVNLSTRISASFEVPKEASVALMLNSNGQYRTSGSINGHPVSFLVDTGANILAMNGRMARNLGLDLSNAKVMRASTAGGMVNSRQIRLDLVNVGGIQVRNVQAVVIKGAYPEDILLGMSFLRNVNISESSGVMHLTAKY